MHYYNFNIADWQSSTRHLTPEEEGVYLRLINHYYDTEKPIPLDTQPVIRRLCLGSCSVIALSILDEFFVKTDRGYEKEKCNDLIKDYKKRSNKNKKNGALGGRPKKHAASEETQSVTSGIPEVSQVEPKHNPNQELRTKNQEPLTNNHNIKDIVPRRQADDTIDKKISRYKFDDYQNQFAIWMSTPVINRFGVSMKIDIDQWSDAVRKIIEIDKVSPQDLEKIWQFIIDHEDGGFSWADQIRTPMKLRARKDGLQYHQKIKSTMERSNHAKTNLDIFDDTDTDWAGDILRKYDSDGNLKSSPEVDPCQLSGVEKLSEQGLERIPEGVPITATASACGESDKLDGENPEGS